ncbi:MAG: hypothetical protein EBT15_09950 [Betaproteobacteria bacterium]|nr:hypothetical protein [Betaproteobacteria bacterium]
MGLDMYLTAKKFVMPDLGPSAETDGIKYQVLASAMGLTQDDLDKFVGYPSAEVHFSVGYWRKFYELHNWFVGRVQQGEDDCRPYYVSKEALEELKVAIAETAADPTSEDHFSLEGSWEDVKEEFEELSKIIDYWLSPTFEGWDFMYQASW